MENTNFELNTFFIIRRIKISLIFLLVLSLFFLNSCTTKVVKERPVSTAGLEHYSLGLYYEENNEDSLAVQEFAQAVAEQPQNPDFLSAFALTLSRIGNYKSSEKYAAEAIRNGSRDENLYIILGNREKGRGNIKKAILFYEKALSDTSNYFLVLSLVQLMRTEDRLDDAAGLLLSLRKRYPTDLRVLAQLGDIYGREKKYELSKNQFEEALNIDSLYYPALLGLGIIYEIKGNADSSLLFYKKAVLIDTTNINLLKKIVSLELLKGFWNDVARDAEKVLSFSPTDTFVRKQLAFALFRFGKKQKALEEYLLLSGLLPEDATIHYFLGRLYLIDNNVEKAEKEFSLSVKYNPDYIPSVEYLYILSYKRNEEEREKEFLNYLKKKEIRTEKIFFSIGTNLYRDKDYDTAKYFFLKSIKENPEYTNSWYSLGFVYDKLDKTDSAEIAFRRVIDMDTTNAGAYNALGYLFVEHNKNLNEAEMLINRALKIDSLNGYIIDSLGWLYFKLGKLHKAKDLLIKAIKYAKDAVLYEHLGDVYEKLGDREKAVGMWRKSLEFNPDNDKLRNKIE